jgi:hypothetical protein
MKSDMETIQNLINELQELKELKRLTLIGINGFSQVLPSFVDFFISHHKMKELDLRDNEIECYSIKKVMKATWSLRKLDLRNNKINEESLERLWSGLQRNISITEFLYKDETNNNEFE